MDTFNTTIKDTLQRESDKLSSDFPYDELHLLNGVIYYEGIGV
jgi:hypothetical protein